MKKQLEELRELVWGEDIQSSTCPEYREHHESIKKILSKLDEIIYEQEEVVTVDNYQVFEDRVKSLLERWSKFNKSHKNMTAKSIKTCLEEINDGFTQQLIKDAEKPVVQKDDYLFYEWLILSKGMNEAEFKKLTKQELTDLKIEYSKFEGSLN